MLPAPNLLNHPELEAYELIRSLSSKVFKNIHIAFACNAKGFAIAMIFFLFLIRSVVFGRTGKSFLSKFRQLLL